MPGIRILTERDLRGLVPLDLAAVDCVEEGFRALSGGKVVMPPILSMAIAEANGERFLAHAEASSDGSDPSASWPRQDGPEVGRFELPVELSTSLRCSFTFSHTHRLSNLR